MNSLCAPSWGEKRTSPPSRKVSGVLLARSSISPGERGPKMSTIESRRICSCRDIGMARRSFPLARDALDCHPLRKKGVGPGPQKVSGVWAIPYHRFVSIDTREGEAKARCLRSGWEDLGDDPRLGKGKEGSCRRVGAFQPHASSFQVPRYSGTRKPTAWRG